MAYSNDGVFAQTIHSFQKKLVDQKSTLSGVTNALQLCAASSTEGLWIPRIWAAPLATLATALRVDLYISPDGSAAQLVDSKTIPIQTIAATDEIDFTEFTRWDAENPLYLGPGESLWGGLSTAFASGINVCGNFEKFTAATVS